eukprot:8519765-Pyramimonas_sp.AAC.1
MVARIVDVRVDHDQIDAGRRSSMRHRSYIVKLVKQKLPLFLSFGIVSLVQDLVELPVMSVPAILHHSAGSRLWLSILGTADSMSAKIIDSGAVQEGVGWVTLATVFSK